MTRTMENFLLEGCREQEKFLFGDSAVEQNSKQSFSAFMKEWEEKNSFVRDLCTRYDLKLLRRERGSSILEYDGIKVTSQKKENKSGNFIGAVHYCCKSWMCPECRKKKGYAVRNSIMEHSSFFKIPRLYTITINRSYFNSPEEAYDYVMKKKFIARLLTKEMGVRRWVWVLEVQENSGDGFPHWHILVDLADLPGVWYNREKKETATERPVNLHGWHYHPHFFDLNKVHRLLKTWKIGEQCSLSLKHSKFSNTEHAVRYITKYLIKMPKRGFPPWMLCRSGIRFFQPSKEIGSLGGHSYKRQTAKSESVKKKKSTLVPADKIAECHQKTFFLEFDEDRKRFQAVGIVKAPLSALKEFSGVEKITLFSKENWQPYFRYGFSDEKIFASFLSQVYAQKERRRFAENIESRRAEILTQWERLSPVAVRSA